MRAPAARVSPLLGQERGRGGSEQARLQKPDLQSRGKVSIRNSLNGKLAHRVEHDCKRRVKFRIGLPRGCNMVCHKPVDFPPTLPRRRNGSDSSSDLSPSPRIVRAPPLPPDSQPESLGQELVAGCLSLLGASWVPGSLTCLKACYLHGFWPLGCLKPCFCMVFGPWDA